MQEAILPEKPDGWKPIQTTIMQRIVNEHADLLVVESGLVLYLEAISEPYIRLRQTGMPGRRRRLFPGAHPLNSPRKDRSSESRTKELVHPSGFLPSY